MKTYEITITEDDINQYMNSFGVTRETAIDELNKKEAQECEIQEIYEWLIRQTR